MAENNQPIENNQEPEEEEENPVIRKVDGYIGRITEGMEIIIALIVLIGFILSLIPLFQNMGGLLQVDGEYTFHSFLSDALNLVIGIEFIRMLVKHTPESVLSVLLFAIARHVVLESAESIDLLIGVLAIMVIFFIRKYLTSRAPYPKCINTKTIRALFSGEKNDTQAKQ